MVTFLIRSDSCSAPKAQAAAATSRMEIRNRVARITEHLPSLGQPHVRLRSEAQFEAQFEECSASRLLLEVERHPGVCGPRESLSRQPHSSSARPPQLLSLC